MSISISVIICTYNRAEELRQTLTSWLTLKAEWSGVELIVVDNSSTDGTASVVESFRASCPGRLRYIMERNSGLSHARNRGIQEAAADLVAFVDDDVDFDEHWLGAVLGAFEREATIACVGGNSIPLFAGQRPDWLTDDFLGYYGSTGSGDVDRPMVFPECPFGLNMAFRKSVFAQVGNFDVQLGRKKGVLLSNEEWEMFHRVSRAGLKVQYVAGALLYHRIPKERVTQEWLLERYYWQGISEVVCRQSLEPLSNAALLRQGLRTLVTGVLPHGRRSPLNWFKRNGEVSFRERLRARRQLGRSRQYLRFAFSRQGAR